MISETFGLEELHSGVRLGYGTTPAVAPLGDAAARWVFKHIPPRLRAFSRYDGIATDWRDPDVGWGLLLGDDPDLSVRQRANAEDAPEPIRELLRARAGATVLRYRAGTSADGRLLWDATSEVDVSIASSPYGVSAGCLPRYVLIYGGPASVPWSIQYALNVTRCVGRLDLEGEALQNYISALLSGWVHVPPVADTAIVWATSDDPGNGTRPYVSEPFVKRLKEDPRVDTDVMFLDGDERATARRLVQALGFERPSAIVISSNGNFEGFENAGASRELIGAPVDQNGTAVDWKDVVSRWEPDGAIWYAIAPYSAGVDDDARFAGLVDGESLLGKTLGRNVCIPAMVAPFARALLGCKRPLRAFVGHVGPLLQVSPLVRDGHSLTAMLAGAIASAATGNEPIASVFAQEWFTTMPRLYAEFDAHIASFNANRMEASTLVRDLLTIFNVERTVILGDPAVVAPAARGKNNV